MSARRRTSLIFTHDSFLDIMFNTVGGLVLLAIMSALASGNIKIKGDLPVVQEVKDEVYPIYLECQGGRVRPMIDQQSEDGQEKFAKDLGAARTIEEFNNIIETWNREKKGGEFYAIEYVFKDEVFNITYRVRKKDSGDTPADLDSETCVLRRTLEWARKKAQGKKVLAIFQTRSDSFEVFKKARSILEANGMYYSLRFQGLEEDISFRLVDGKIGYEKD